MSALACALLLTAVSRTAPSRASRAQFLEIHQFVGSAIAMAVQGQNLAAAAAAAAAADAAGAARNSAAAAAAATAAAASAATTASTTTPAAEAVVPQPIPVERVPSQSSIGSSGSSRQDPDAFGSAALPPLAAAVDSSATASSVTLERYVPLRAPPAPTLDSSLHPIPPRLIQTFARSQGVASQVVL